MTRVDEMGEVNVVVVGWNVAMSLEIMFAGDRRRGVGEGTLVTNNEQEWEEWDYVRGQRVGGSEQGWFSLIIRTW